MSSVAESPLKIKHPFHPQHDLTLTGLPFIAYCDACGKENHGDDDDSLTYYCFDFECEFCLNVRCAALVPAANGGMQQQQQSGYLHHRGTHSHPIILCKDTWKDSDLLCSCCNAPIKKGGLIFVCLECKVVLDESCVGLPKEIQHPFHKEHPLALSSVPGKGPYARACNACGFEVESMNFSCSSCNFRLDFHCASLLPTTNDTEQVMPHPHPLISCSKTKNSFRRLSCSGCLRNFEEEESIYVCLECKMLLHRSCASLPHEIVHPFHATHRLRLDHFRNYGVECDVCQKNLKGFYYKCHECVFFTHSKCVVPRPFFINSEQHQHPLALFETKELTLICEKCYKRCNYPFFRCVMCRFNLHIHCLSELPDTVKHKSHLHGLTLTYTPIKDYADEEDDAEFYCDACEEERKLDEPAYHCAECNYVAHVHCGISEILHYLQSELSSKHKFGNVNLNISLDDARDNARIKWESDVEEEEEHVDNLSSGICNENDVKEDEEDELVDIFATGIHMEDQDQGRARVDDHSTVAETEELVDIEIASDESDEGNGIVRVDELKAQLEMITRQLEKETTKLNRRKERRDHH